MMKIDIDTDTERCRNTLRKLHYTVTNFTFVQVTPSGDHLQKSENFKLDETKSGQQTLSRVICQF